MPFALPDDVVAIDTGKKSLLFYVYADRNGNNILSYLESPDQYGNGNFSVNRIAIAKNPFRNNEEESIVVSPNNKQVAAVTWTGPQGIEVRVYYVGKDKNLLRELCKTGDGGWYVGSLSVKGNKYKVTPGTSISASVHTYQPGNSYNLRVFAAEDGEVNDKDLPQISVFKFLHDESGKAASWQGDYITEAIERY
ncbi:hypothetical protein ACKRZS_013882 [Fusarium odoratissimum]